MYKLLRNYGSGTSIISAVNTYNNLVVSVSQWFW